jgi:hypothetical protein
MLFGGVIAFNAISPLTGRFLILARAPLLGFTYSTSRSSPAARRCWRDCDLDPEAARAGSIGAIDLL